MNTRFHAGFCTFLDCLKRIIGGDGGSRTHDTGLSPYASLAGKCLRPLGHVSTLKTNSESPLQQAPDNIFLGAFGQSKLIVSLRLVNQAFSRPKALCNARTASSMYFSSINTEILISDVEIIWILIPSSDRVRNICVAIPT